jgi:hypothetical protein
LIWFLRALAVAAVLLGLGLMICPGTQKGNPTALVRDSLRGRPEPFHASCLLVSDGEAQRFSMRGTGNRFLDTLESSLPAGTPDRRLVLQAFQDAASGIRYQPLLEGQARIAGRLCSTVRLKPPSKNAQWYQLWIDPRAHLVLAWRHWKHDGMLISSMSVMEVHLEN